MRRSAGSKNSTAQSAGRPSNARCMMRRGRLLYRAGLFHRALNDFRKARELDGTNAEADAYIEMLQEIFDFRYTDLYNP